MTETISMTFSEDDKKTFEKFSGMNFAAGMKLLMDNVKYGGQLGFDPFWSEENQTVLAKSIDDANHGRNMHEHDLIEV